MAKKKRHQYPDVPERLPHPVVDNHTHLAARREMARLEELARAGAAEAEEGRAQSGGAYVASAGVARIGAGDASIGVDSGSENPAAEAPPSRHLNVPEHLDRMERAGVRHAITCGCEVPELEPTVAVASMHPHQLSAAIAIHPNEAALHCGITEESPDGLTHGLDPWHREYSLADAVGLVEELARRPGVVAIGETGLDYYRTGEAGKAAQAESFRLHIELAKQLDLPLQIHDREAHADTIRILTECGAPERTVFHCFSGDVEMARICAAHGWYGSFGGSMTYPVNESLREAFLAFPPELLLAETDAPYLAPVPWRGHPNAAYAVAYTVRAQAELRGSPLQQWCEQIDTNTRTVYGV